MAALRLDVVVFLYIRLEILSPQIQSAPTQGSTIWLRPSGRAMKNKSHSHWDPESTPTLWINHASRLLMRHFEERLRPLDFGMAYLPVAIALEENGALPQRQLAEHAHVEQPTMAALLVRMERDGLISREPHPSDKRSSLISLLSESPGEPALGEGATRGCRRASGSGIQ